MTLTMAGWRETVSPKWNVVIINLINCTWIFKMSAVKKVNWETLLVVSFIFKSNSLCSQRPLVLTTGRMSRLRPATCCFIPTVSPGAQCRSRHTGRRRYAVVHTASSPALKERLMLTLTSTVHFMEPDSREHSTQRA